MRLVSIGVIVGFIALSVAMVPTGSASSVSAGQGDCWISINDPTNPTWTDDCEELPEFDDTQSSPTVGDCWISINDPTNPTWTDECEELPELEDIRATQRAGDCWISINDPTNPTWTDECEEILDVAPAGVHVKASLVDASATLDPIFAMEDESGCVSACSVGTDLNTVIDVGRLSVSANVSTNEDI